MDFLDNSFIKAAQAEKRKAEDDVLAAEAVKRKVTRVEGDVPTEVIAEILAIITDPNEMIGPDVSLFTHYFPHCSPTNKFLFSRQTVAI